MTLLSIFESLPRPVSDGCFAVEASSAKFRVGKSFEGFPALLISFDGASFESLPRRLANIGYSPPKDVELTGGGRTHAERLAVLECRTQDSELVEYFFRIVGSALVEDPKSTTAAGFEVALDAIISLFRALQTPAERTVQGLWAELAVISWAHEPDIAIVGWHSGPRALHDFSGAESRLEVKGSSTGLREHAFRLDQLRVGGEGHTVVASLLLDESVSGANIFDLVGRIESRVSGVESRRRLQAIVARSLGSSWKEAGELRYDEALARQRLRLFRAESVPCIALPVRAEVKDVSFTVDLSTTAGLALSEARLLGRFFESVLPTG